MVVSGLVWRLGKTLKGIAASGRVSCSDAAGWCGWKNPSKVPAQGSQNPRPAWQQAASHFVLISFPDPVSKALPQPRNEQLGHGFYPPIVS